MHASLPQRIRQLPGTGHGRVQRVGDSELAGELAELAVRNLRDRLAVERRDNQRVLPRIVQQRMFGARVEFQHDGVVFSCPGLVGRQKRIDRQESTAQRSCPPGREADASAVVLLAQKLRMEVLHVGERFLRDLAFPCVFRVDVFVVAGQHGDHAVPGSVDALCFAPPTIVGVDSPHDGILLVRVRGDSFLAQLVDKLVGGFFGAHSFAPDIGRRRLDAGHHDHPRTMLFRKLVLLARLGLDLADMLGPARTVL